MPYSLDNPPKLSARNAAGRLIQIAGRPGEIGRFDNVVVPDEREIRRLRPAMIFLGKLKSVPFNYGTARRFGRRFKPTTPTTTPDPFNHLDNLPRFQKP